MKFSLNWLSEYLKIELSPKELAEKLTLAGFEVEEIIFLGQELQGIITVKIEKIERHPNADKLVICQVSDGNNTYQIITGADNVFEGAIVPASLPGAVLANGLKIKKASLRGIESFGMLCSQQELGLVESAKGIWILPEKTPIGVDVVEYFKLKDTILDIAILPNRGDCQSILGLARDIAVILNQKINFPKIKLIEEKIQASYEIKIKDFKLCPKYTARIITDIKVKESPFWLQLKLLRSGIRPINNIVDITNYILLLCGQPLHAFDLDLLENKKIIVRKARKDEEIITLDEEKRKLNEDTLLICDGQKPIAIAGIMGGQNTQIQKTTKNVLLESAFFKPGNIRKTSQKLGLRSESSIRFEKGVDFNLIEYASDLAVGLMQQLAEAKVLKGIISSIDTTSIWAKSKNIEFSSKKINLLLGTDFSELEIKNILTKLGINIIKNQAIIPSWRQNDIAELPCLAEEISRIKNLSNIPTQLPSHFVPIDKPNILEILINNSNQILTSSGFYEIKNFPMISDDDLKNLLQPKSNLYLKNPLTPKETLMRPNLLPSLLKTTIYNLKRQQENLKLFEIGKIFTLNKNNTPQEEIHLTAIITGQINPYAYTMAQKQINIPDLPYLKNLIEKILAKNNFSQISYKEKSKPYFHPKKSLNIYLRGTLIGEIGFIHPKISLNFEIEKEIAVLNLNLSIIKSIPFINPIYKPFSKFPSSRRDIAMLMPKSITYDDIVSIIEKFKNKTLKKYFIFDYFENEKIGKDKKSLAFAFIYQSEKNTLKDEQVNIIHQQLITNIKKNLPIEIR